MEISCRCRMHMVKKRMKEESGHHDFFGTPTTRSLAISMKDLVKCKVVGRKDQNLTKFPRSFRCRSHGFCLAEPKNQGWILILCPNQPTHSHIHTQSHRIYLFISFTSSYHHPDESVAHLIPLRGNCRVDMWCYAILSTSDMDFRLESRVGIIGGL